MFEPARREIFATVLLLCSLTGVAAQTPVTVGGEYRAEYLAAHVAREKGLFDERTIRVEATELSREDVVSALSDGSIRIAAMPVATLLEATCDGADLVAVAGAARGRGERQRTVALLTRPGAGISGPADLRGKRVGVPPSPPMFARMFEKWLVRNGLSVSEVSIVAVDSGRVPQMFRDARVDATVAVEPVAEGLVGSGQATRLSYFLEELSAGSMADLYVAQRRWSAENAPAIAAFRAGLRKGVEAIRADPAGAAGVLATMTSYRRPGGEVDYAVDVTEKDLTFIHDLGVALNMITCPVDLGALIAK